MPNLLKERGIGKSAPFTPPSHPSPSPSHPLSSSLIPLPSIEESRGVGKRTRLPPPLNTLHTENYYYHILNSIFEFRGSPSLQSPEIGSAHSALNRLSIYSTLVKLSLKGTFDVISSGTSIKESVPDLI